VLRGWLLSVDLSDFDRFDAPSMTDAKIAMIEASRSPLSADIREAIALGGLGVGRDVLVTDMLNDLVKTMGGRSASTTTMSSIMREMGWARLEKTVKWNGKPRRVYYLPGPWCEGLEGADLATVLRERLQDTELDRPEIDDRQGVLDPANW
jgi:hypothetical protein